MAKTIRFYSGEELKELQQIQQLSKKERRGLTEKFAKKHKRNVASVYNKMSKMSKKTKGSFVKDVSLKTSPSSKKGEFVIPVKNWKLQHEDGNLSIVINF
jgi:hypothetical protein